MKMEQTERSEMSAYKIQTPGNHPQESIQHTAYSTQHTVHSIQHTAHSIQHTAYSIQHTAHSIQHTAYSIQHTAYSTQHTAHSTQHSEDGESLKSRKQRVVYARVLIISGASCFSLKLSSQAQVLFFSVHNNF